LDPDERDTQVMFYLQRHREQHGKAGNSSKSDRTRKTTLPKSGSNKVSSARRSITHRTGGTAEDPMIIDTSDEEASTSSNKKHIKDASASKITGNERNVAALIQASSKTSQNDFSKPGAARGLVKANEKEANVAAKLHEDSTSAKAQPPKALLNLRTKTLEAFIPKERLQGSRLLHAVRNASTVAHNINSSPLQAKEPSEAASRDLAFGSIGLQAREEANRTGVHPFNRPMADMQKMADENAVRRAAHPTSASHLTQDDTDRELRAMHLRAHVSKATLAATDPISRAQVALANTEIDLTAARVDVKNATQKNRIAILHANKLGYNNRYGKTLTPEQLKFQPYVDACQQELDSAEQTVHELRVKVRKAKETLRGLGVEVDMADGDVDLDPYANGSGPKPPENEWEALWGYLGCDDPDSDDDAEKEENEEPPSKKQKVSQ